MIATKYNDIDNLNKLSIKIPSIHIHTLCLKKPIFFSSLPSLNNTALEDQQRITRDLEERRYRAEEERKRLELERVAAEQEQRRALERANMEKEEKQRMVSQFFFLLVPLKCPIIKKARYRTKKRHTLFFSFIFIHIITHKYIFVSKKMCLA